jgi:glycosyltransferase involved in cell wall biosynthesis
VSLAVLLKPTLNNTCMKISVLTPCLNSSKWLGRAIESVLKQNYANWEHIVVDGGSNDGTIELLKSYNHLVWISEPDKGQSDAMNKAFGMASGDIIVYLNADDWFDDAVFLEVVGNFSKDTDIVIGDGTIVYSNGRKPYRWRSAHSYRRCMMHYKYNFPYNPVSYFYRRGVQLELGGFNPDNHYTMDYEFILKMLSRFHAVKVCKNFGFFWLDGRNKTSTRNNLMDCHKTVVQHCLNSRDYVSLAIYYLNSYYFLYTKLKKGVRKIVKKKRLIENRF